MKEFFQGMYQKPHFAKRFIACLIAVCIMGFCVSWLNLINLGTDPCSAMNFGLSDKLGMTFGNWQALLNVGLFVVVILVDKRSIGFGTVLNMFMVGYACDFTTWCRQKLWPDLQMDNLVIRTAAMLIILAVFVFAVAVYMSVELGTAPYDAIPIIIGERQKVLSFRVVRIIFDCVVTVIAIAAGATVGIVTVLMAFTIGPVAAYVKKHIERFLQ